MSDVDIVTLEEKHIDGILRVSNLSFHTAWNKESFLNELDNSFARYVVAVKDDIVIGFGGLWLIIDEGHITNIAVHPEFRGTGVGSALLEALIEICKLEAACGVTLEVRKSNIPAQNLYKKYGFVEEGLRKGYYGDNKEDAIIMWKRNLYS